MNILGISFGFHDSSVALIKEGKVFYAVSEERFSRIKQDSSFPVQAINFILKEASITIQEIDKVVYYEDNLLKLDRIITNSALDNNQEYFNKVINSWISNDNLNLENKIAINMGINPEDIICFEHHLSHASAAYYPSGFDESTIVILDGVGEYDTISIFKGEGNKISEIKKFKLPNSVGLFYSAYTSFLGFQVNEGEYKVMGMAPYGKPIYKDKILKTIKFEDDTFEIKKGYFNFLTPLNKLYTNKLVELFGEPRESEVPFFTPDFISLAPEYMNEEEKISLAQENLHYSNIAASLQSVTEDIVLNIIRKAIALTSCENLCLAGGVALNSVINGKVRDSLGIKNLFIQPAAGDSGSALGSALYYLNNYCDEKINYIQNTALLGEKLEYADIKADLFNNLYKEDISEFQNENSYFDKISDLIISGKVIGWVNGRFEWGPRALGARSILADPRKEEMKLIVNEKIKFREPFRPFAPSVLYEEAHKWFDIDEDLLANAPENFMLTVSNVKKEKREKIPAIVHVDGTARVQLVRKDVNYEYYMLIKSFFEKTGVPLILNTSFNLKGEPVVRTAKDALRTFSYSEMDYLAIYPFLVKSYWENI